MSGRTAYRALRLAVLLATAPLAAIAQDYLSEAGQTYARVEKGDGWTLRSSDIVQYHIGAAGRLVEGVETLHLRPDCSAKSSLLGEGSWSWANGGISASFAGPAFVAFPRQDLSDAPEACRA